MIVTVRVIEGRKVLSSRRRSCALSTVLTREDGVLRYRSSALQAGTWYGSSSWMPGKHCPSSGHDCSLLRQSVVSEHPTTVRSAVAPAEDPTGHVRHPWSQWLDKSPYTTSPPMTVAPTVTSRIVSTSMSKTSSDKTTMSASCPTRSVPFSLSSPTAYAEP